MAGPWHILTLLSKVKVKGLSSAPGMGMKVEWACPFVTFLIKSGHWFGFCTTLYKSSLCITYDYWYGLLHISNETLKFANSWVELNWILDPSTHLGSSISCLGSGTKSVRSSSLIVDQ